MRGGDVNEFIDGIFEGYEQVFWYRGKKYFIQGYNAYGKCLLLLDLWEPPGTDYVWQGSSVDGYPAEEFLSAKIWDGRDFRQAQEEMEWVDF